MGDRYGGRLFWFIINNIVMNTIILNELFKKLIAWSKENYNKPMADCPYPSQIEDAYLKLIESVEIKYRNPYYWNSSYSKIFIPNEIKPILRHAFFYEKTFKDVEKVFLSWIEGFIEDSIDHKINEICKTDYLKNDDNWDWYNENRNIKIKINYKK